MGVLPYAENADWVLTSSLDALNDAQSGEIAFKKIPNPSP